MLFKDTHIEFLRRVDGDLLLTCTDGPSIRSAVLQAKDTGDRINVPLLVQGFVNSFSAEVPVIRAKMTLSLKISKSS